MPEIPHITHGPNKYLPFQTTKDVLEFLSSPSAKKLNLPNMEPAKEVSFDETNADHKRLDQNRIAPAILSSSGNGLFHYNEDRLLTVREIASIQNFPLRYEIFGTRREQIQQVANAVPIEFSRAIARSVRQSLRNLYDYEIESNI